MFTAHAARRLSTAATLSRLPRHLPTAGSTRLTTYPRRAQWHPVSRRAWSQGPISSQEAYARLQNAKPLFNSGGSGGDGNDGGNRNNKKKPRRQWIRLPSMRRISYACVGGAAAFYYFHRETVPVSERKRFNCFPESLIATLGAWEARALVEDIERQGGRFLPEWDSRTRLVKKVMSRLIPVSGGGRLVDSTTRTPPHEGGPADVVGEGAEWEVRVIDDPDTANAFVLPGGKVFVHSGILRATHNEAGLAAVLGHEIAHNMASHVAERMSNDLGFNILLYTSSLLSYGLVFFVFSEFGGMKNFLLSMPMSRKQESEADYIGLMLMAEACYDPREALGFWRRMSWYAQQHGREPPELLSTHPSNESRIEMISQWMPEAMEKWQSSSCQGTSTFADAFRLAKEMGSRLY